MHLLQYEPLLVQVLRSYAMLQQKSPSFADWLQLINVHPLLFLNCHAAVIIRTYCSLIALRTRLRDLKSMFPTLKLHLATVPCW